MTKTKFLELVRSSKWDVEIDEEMSGDNPYRQRYCVILRGSWGFRGLTFEQILYSPDPSLVYENKDEFDRRLKTHKDKFNKWLKEYRNGK